MPQYHGFGKTCPVCREEFIGRKNKVFCTSTCKNRYHNDANAEVRAHERELSSILVKNERVLRELMKDHITEDPKQVRIETMDLLGFNQKGPYTTINTKENIKWYKVGKFAYRYLIDQRVFMIHKLN